MESWQSISTDQFLQLSEYTKGTGSFAAVIIRKEQVVVVCFLDCRWRMNWFQSHPAETEKVLHTLRNPGSMLFLLLFNITLKRHRLAKQRLPTVLLAV